MSDMPELVLHIGAGKTGSTSIQFTLKKHLQELPAQGASYAGLVLEYVPGATRHGWCAEGQPQKYFRAPDMAKAKDEAYQVIRGELERQGRAGVRRVIWSNEAFLSRGDRILGVVERLRSEGVRVRPIAYVRRHDEWARSGYVQFGIKFKTYTGPLRSFGEWIEQQNIGFAKDLAIWQKAFPDTLEVYNFDALPDVTQHFLGLAELSGIETVRANDSPSNALLAAWAVFNGRQEQQTLPHAFTRLAAPLKVLTPKGRPVPPLEELLPTTEDLRGIQGRYAEDFDKVNALLAARGEPPLVFDDPREKSRGVSGWEIDRMLLQMVFALQRQVLELQDEVSELKKEKVEQ